MSFAHTCAIYLCSLLDCSCWVPHSPFSWGFWSSCHAVRRLGERHPGIGKGRRHLKHREAHKEIPHCEQAEASAVHAGVSAHQPGRSDDPPGNSKVEVLFMCETTAVKHTRNGRAEASPHSPAHLGIHMYPGSSNTSFNSSSVPMPKHATS